MHQAWLEGMGFAFLPKWLISDDLAPGRLERVLPEKLFFAGRLLAVYPSRKYLSVKVRSFLDFIARDSRLRLAGRSKAVAYRCWTPAFTGLRPEAIT